MKPMIIIAPGTMSPDDIALLRENGICVVVSTKPAAIKFVDPIASAMDRTAIESAAIRFSRILLNGQWGGWDSSKMISRDTMAQIFTDILIKGTPLGKDEGQQGQKQGKESGA